MSDHVHAQEHLDEEDHDTLHVTVGGYVTGFVLSVILTAIPFWLVMGKVLPNPTMTTATTTKAATTPPSRATWSASSCRWC